MSPQRLLQRFWRTLTGSGLGPDERGNVALIFAGASVPLVMAISLSVDFGVSRSAQASLDAAADAAALKGVRTAIDYINDHMNSGKDPTSDALAVGRSAAFRAFSANAGLPSMTTVPTPTVEATRTGSTVSIAVSYSTTTETSLAKVAGFKQIKLAGTAKAEASLPSYYQIVFLVDVSNSMGIGGTSAAVSRLKTEIGCEFACHDTKGYYGWDTREWARQHQVKLKIDFVSDALKAFLDAVETANAKSPIPNLYSVGIATFGTTYNYSLKPTTDFTKVRAAATAIDTESVTPPGTNWGYTETSTALVEQAKALSNIGDGSAPSRMKTFVVFITDGIEDAYTPGYWYGGRNTGLQYARYCPDLKSKGATVITIAAPYPRVPEAAYDNLVLPYEAKIEPTLRDCASGKDWFFSAADGPAIVAASAKVFENIVKVPTLTD